MYSDVNDGRMMLGAESEGDGIVIAADIVGSRSKQLGGMYSGYAVRFHTGHESEHSDGPQIHSADRRAQDAFQNTRSTPVIGIPTKWIQMTLKAA